MRKLALIPSLLTVSIAPSGTLCRTISTANPSGFVSSTFAFDLSKISGFDLGPVDPGTITAATLPTQEGISNRNRYEQTQHHDTLLDEAHRPAEIAKVHGSSDEGPQPARDRPDEWFLAHPTAIAIDRTPRTFGCDQSKCSATFSERKQLQYVYRSP